MPEELKHGMNCPALAGDEDCTCGLYWRQQLAAQICALPIAVANQEPSPDFYGMFATDTCWAFGWYHGRTQPSIAATKSVPCFVPQGAPWLLIEFTHWMPSPSLPGERAAPALAPIAVGDQMPVPGVEYQFWIPIHGGDQDEKQIAEGGSWENATLAAGAGLQRGELWNAGIPFVRIFDHGSECYATHYLPLPNPPETYRQK
jgi:hypothetical protein